MIEMRTERYSNAPTSLGNLPNLLVDCKLVGLSENAQRSTPNFQRSIQKAFHSDLDSSSSYAQRFCTVCISGLDVQRWTLDVGRLLLL